MSIAVAISGPSGIVVASDTRIIGPDGTIRPPSPKTFRLLDDAVLGAHAGLMEVDGISVPAHLADICRGVRRGAGIGQLAEHFAAQLNSRLEMNKI